MQQLIIAGGIGRDAELRSTGGGDKVANFSVAVDNGKDRDGNKRETTWFDCSLWGKRGEGLGPYLTKGTRVAVTGRPTAREHNGKVYMGVNVDQITLMGGGQSSGNGYGAPAGQQAGQSQGGGYGNNLEDDIPF